MRVRVPKPTRTFLEMDELVALIEAAEAQDRVPVIPVAIQAGDRTRDHVARLAAAGKRPSAIAQELGIAKATVSFHLGNLGAANTTPYSGRRAIVEMLGRSGLRVSELCDLRLRDVRLHDPDGARFRIPDAKTEAGIREVQMTPELVDRFTEHLARLRVTGRSTGPDDFAFPNLRGGRISRQRVGKVLREAAQLASERLQEQGRPPLPTTTPHTLRRTYISIALLANGFDVKWVMSQVWHADSKMTLDVYAQLEQRADRSHGTSFDALIRKVSGQRGDVDWPTFGPREPNIELGAPPKPTKKRRRKRALCRHFGGGETRTRTGDTTIFSRVLSRRVLGVTAEALVPLRACERVSRWASPDACQGRRGIAGARRHNTLAPVRDGESAIAGVADDRARPRRVCLSERRAIEITRGCRISRGRWRNPQRARGRDVGRLGCARNQRQRCPHIGGTLENPTTNGRGRRLVRQPQANAKAEA
jgi:site-specific recombinase XerD